VFTEKEEALTGGHARPARMAASLLVSSLLSFTPTLHLLQRPAAEPACPASYRAAITTMCDAKRKPDPSEGAGAVTVAVAAASVLGLSVGVGSLLGFSTGLSADNDGLGVPLSTEEVRRLVSSDASTDTGKQDSDGGPLSAEDAREDQAILNVIMGMPTRAK
jgi:hypothetical protein